MFTNSNDNQLPSRIHRIAPNTTRATSVPLKLVDAAARQIEVMMRGLGNLLNVKETTPL